jgi:hypothetical protein
LNAAGAVTGISPVTLANKVFRRLRNSSYGRWYFM